MRANPSTCHQVVCGNGNAASCAAVYGGGGQERCASDSELHEIRCCSDLAIANWSRRAGCTVWTESDAWSEGCQILNWPTAAAFCHHQGGRLCLATEISDGCAAGTGCHHDSDLLWAASSNQTVIPANFGPVCAAEHGHCICNGSVIYGIGQTWTIPRPVTGDVACSNNVFGDPLRSVGKQCRCQSSTLPVCSSASVVATATAFLGRNQTCMTAVQASMAGQVPWDALSNCPCYMLVPQTNASQFTCRPGPNAVSTLYDDWLQCQSLALSQHNATPGSSHMVECGSGVASTCVANGYGGSGRSASDSEMHEVRCCSDAQIFGWTKRAGCSVWTESDLWSQGCSISPFWDAEALCRSQGARLCTAVEVTTSCARGTGCGHDNDFIWTSSTVCSNTTLSAVANRYVVVPLAPTALHESPAHITRSINSSFESAILSPTPTGYVWCAYHFLAAGSPIVVGASALIV